MLLDSLVPLMIRNDSDHTIPPFGCVQIDGDVVLSGSDLIFPVVRPTASVVNQGNPTRFLVNGDNEIEAGDCGAAYAFSPMALASVDDSIGVDPSVNWKQFCGPVAGSFILGKGFYFEVIAKCETAEINSTSDSEVYLVQRLVQKSFIGVAATDITTAAGGKVDIKGFNGSFAYNVPGEEIDVITIVGDIQDGATVLGLIVDNAAVVIEVCE